MPGRLKLSIRAQGEGTAGSCRSHSSRLSHLSMSAAPLASESEKTAFSRERADRRRSVVRTVREQRERLISTSGTRPEFDLELALIFARNRVSAGYALPMLVAIVAIASLLWLDTFAACVWAA